MSRSHFGQASVAFGRIIHLLLRESVGGGVEDAPDPVQARTLADSRGETVIFEPDLGELGEAAAPVIC